MKSWSVWAVIGLVLIGAVYAKGFIEDYGKDRFLAGYAQGKDTKQSQEGEPWMREFAKAYCSLDAEKVASYVSENLATLPQLQAEFKGAREMGWDCKEARVLGTWEGKYGTEFAFLTSFPDYSIWWLVISQNGKVVHIE